MKRIVSILLALLCLLGAAQADESTLVVSGSGSVSLEADCVSATMGVELSGTDLTSLQQRVNTTIATICEALQAAGLDEKNISTDQFYVSPVYDYSGSYASSSGGRELISGYTISNTLSIQTDALERIGAYIDAAFAAGANSFNSIHFSAKDDSAARRQALEQAVADAREKAEIIAAAAGKAIEGVIEIREGGVNSYAKTSYDGWNTYAVAEGASAGATVRASQVVVTANVQITYEIR